MAHRSAIINVMVKAAFRAARTLRRDFGEVEQLQVSKKGPADFVTAADTKAEEILFESLSEARPNFGFLMEEAGERGPDKSDQRWIVDPLDGTTNFLHGLPHFAISIAAEEAGQLTAAVILDPIKDELFWAEKGRGAFLNDRRLRVSARRSLDVALLATGVPWSGRPGHDRFLAEIAAFMPRIAGIRRYGAASLDLAYVAAGRYDGFWESDLNAWDIAAGILIVAEAGGIATEIDGGSEMLQSGSILASNADLHQDMLQILRKARQT